MSTLTENSKEAVTSDVFLPDVLTTSERGQHEEPKIAPQSDGSTAKNLMRTEKEQDRAANLSRGASLADSKAESLDDNQEFVEANSSFSNNGSIDQNDDDDDKLTYKDVNEDSEMEDVDAAKGADEKLTIHADKESTPQGEAKQSESVNNSLKNKDEPSTSKNTSIIPDKNSEEILKSSNEGDNEPLSKNLESADGTTPNEPKSGKELEKNDVKVEGVVAAERKNEKTALVETLETEQSESIESVADEDRQDEAKDEGVREVCSNLEKTTLSKNEENSNVTSNLNLGDASNEKVNENGRKYSGKKPTEKNVDVGIDEEFDDEDGDEDEEHDDDDAEGELDDEEDYDDEETADEEEGGGEGPDEDEIKSSPAYIPKSGRFYMHDLRNNNGSSSAADDEGGGTTTGNETTTGGIEEGEVKSPSTNLTVPRLRSSRADRAWEHDLFDDKLQRPKSSKELVKRYGRDIRRETMDGCEVDELQNETLGAAKKLAARNRVADSDNDADAGHMEGDEGGSDFEDEDDDSATAPEFRAGGTGGGARRRVRLSSRISSRQRAAGDAPQKITPNRRQRNTPSLNSGTTTGEGVGFRRRSGAAPLPPGGERRRRRQISSGQLKVSAANNNPSSCESEHRGVVNEEIDSQQQSLPRPIHQQQQRRVGGGYRRTIVSSRFSSGTQNYNNVGVPNPRRQFGNVGGPRQRQQPPSHHQQQYQPRNDFRRGDGAPPPSDEYAAANEAEESTAGEITPPPHARQRATLASGARGSGKRYTAQRQGGGASNFATNNAQSTAAPQQQQFVEPQPQNCGTANPHFPPQHHHNYNNNQQPPRFNQQLNNSYGNNSNPSNHNRGGRQSYNTGSAPTNEKGYGGGGYYGGRSQQQQRYGGQAQQYQQQQPIAPAIVPPSLRTDIPPPTFSQPQQHQQRGNANNYLNNYPPLNAQTQHGVYRPQSQNYTVVPTSAPPQQHHQRLRQPTEAVYFDPNQQQHSAQATAAPAAQPPQRERRRLQIASPAK